MNNTTPFTYEELRDERENQWVKWRQSNGRIVNIYETEEECIKDWFLTSNLAPRTKSKSLYRGSLSKKIFFDTESSKCILLNIHPYPYITLGEERSEDWMEWKQHNGRTVDILKNLPDCIMERNSRLVM